MQLNKQTIDTAAS